MNRTEIDKLLAELEIAAIKLNVNEFMSNYKQDDYAAGVLYGFERCIEFLKQYLNGNK